MDNSEDLKLVNETIASLEGMIVDLEERGAKEYHICHLRRTVNSYLKFKKVIIGCIAKE